MRSCLTALLFSLTLYSCNSNRGGQTSEDELSKVIIGWYDALAKKDSARMDNLTARNFLLYDEGTIYSNQSALAMVKQLPPFTASFSIDSVHSHIDKNYASMYYLRGAVFSMNDTATAPMRFLENATFLKEGDEWRIRFIHSSMRK